MRFSLPFSKAEYFLVYFDSYNIKTEFRQVMIYKYLKVIVSYSYTMFCKMEWYPTKCWSTFPLILQLQIPITIIK